MIYKKLPISKRIEYIEEYLETYQPEFLSFVMEREDEGYLEQFRHTTIEDEPKKRGHLVFDGKEVKRVE